MSRVVKALPPAVNMLDWQEHHSAALVSCSRRPETVFHRRGGSKASRDQISKSWVALSWSVGICLWIISRRAHRLACRGKAADDHGGLPDSRSGGNILGKVQGWVDEKKNAAQGGAAGAMIGGMLMGPLGSMVGAEIGSKCGNLLPNLDEVLDSMECDTGNSEETSKVVGGGGSASARDSASYTQKSTEGITDNRFPGGEEPITSQRNMKVPSAPTYRQRAAKTDFDKADAIFQASVEQSNKLELDVQRHYRDAEGALAVGDEPSARAALVSKAAAEQKLAETRKLQADAKIYREQKKQKLMALDPTASVEFCHDRLSKDLAASKRSFGSQKPGLHFSEASLDELAALKQNAPGRRCDELEAEAANLYARAEKALHSGDELGARSLLNLRTEKLTLLKELRGARDVTEHLHLSGRETL